MSSTSPELVNRLYDEIASLGILDPHSHVNPHAAAAAGLDDILGYHYYTELAHAAGMDQGPLDPKVSARDRAVAIARFLPALRNTVQYSWLLEIARTFFDFEQDEINSDTIESLFDQADRKCSGADWEKDVLKKSNIEQVFLTNDFDDPLEGFDPTLYVPCLRTDDLVFHLDDPTVVDRLRHCTDLEICDAKGLRDAIDALFKKFLAKGARACAISLPPNFEPVPVVASGVDSAVRSVLAAQELNEWDAVQVSRFVFWTLAEFCSEYRLPFDLMIGVNRKVYRNGVFQGQDLFDQRTSLYQYRELFNHFAHVTFPISVLSSGQNQELVSYAWIFPNVATNGHWWYSNVPSYIEADARARLTALPSTKQIGYYSDAYKLEFVLPKFNMYRRCLAKLLAADFVSERGWSEEQAIELARQVLVTNPGRIFRCGE